MLSNPLCLGVELEAIRDSHVFFESLREKKSMAVPTPLRKPLI